MNDDFFDSLRNGADLETACYAHGVSIQALYRLLERGMHEERRLGEDSRRKPKKTEEASLTVWKKVSQAQAQAKMRVQKSFHSQSLEDWRGALSWLERRDFTNFGKIEERIKVDELEKKNKGIEK